MANLTLKSLPVEDRPRERLFDLGVSTLSTFELLQLILGQGVPGQSVSVTAQELLKKFDSLTKLSQASLSELIQVKGIGKAKAAQLKAIFELAWRLAAASSKSGSTKPFDAASVYQLVKRQLRDFHKEHFYVIALNISRVVIEQVSIGILDAALVHPREVFGPAIKSHASSIIVAHNHPSGIPLPSEADIELTRRLDQAGMIMGIKLIDHLIITQKSYFSFHEQKLL